MAKWFYKQSKLIQVILLILPLVGWIVELLVRWSSFISRKSAWNLLWAIIFTFFGWTWILAVIDLIYLLLVGHLIGAKA